MKKYLLSMAVLMAGLSFTACSSSDDDENSGNESAYTSTLQTINKQFVNKTVIPTYKGLADACEELLETVEDMDSQSDLQKACDQWKTARQYWEWSEAFLFGAASGYSIDPHIDTWPFDVTAFNNFMSKYNSTELSDADITVLNYNVTTGQNLTGFHALEYLIFRDGSARTYSDLTVLELTYAKLVAADIYLSACRLEAAWAGIDNVSSDRQELLAEAEMEPEDNFGEEFINAGQAGSRWKTVLSASVQIIDGCNEIIGEVRDSKIGAPATGSNVNYIESPHAYNSIQDFYDNIMSCKHALYGGLTVSGTSPVSGSLMSFAQTVCPTEASAAMTAMEAALTAIKNMKSPFVLYYSDASATNAMSKLNDLEDALDDMKGAIEDVVNN